MCKPGLKNPDFTGIIGSESQFSMQKNKKKKLPKITASEKLTKWIGTPASLFVHTLFFIACLLLIFMGLEPERVMLVLTTIVSLEAIYLAIFIQMTVNRSMESLREVEEDIEELAEDVGEIAEDVEELAEELEEEEEKKKESPIAKTLSVIPVPFGKKKTQKTKR